MQTIPWAFTDNNNIVIHIALVDLTTFEMDPPFSGESYEMVKCYEERGVCELGMRWNWELNKFEYV